MTDYAHFLVVVCAECAGGLAARLIIMAGPLYGVPLVGSPWLLTLRSEVAIEEEQHFMADLESFAPSAAILSKNWDAVCS